jgi:predicted transposase YdaD
MIKVSDFFKEENDFLYRKGEIKGQETGEARGEEKGRKIGKEQAISAFVKNLIAEPGISDEQAARIAEVKIDYVLSLRAQKNNKKGPK